jgi:putative FmdB family regulatory protein
MPIFEYACKACNCEFEAIVPRGAQVACPSCGASGPEQKISTFAVSTPGTRNSALAKARAKNAKTLQDKAIADHDVTHHHHE